MVEEKARKAVEAARDASNSPLLLTMPKVRAAVNLMAEAVEALAHEVEILKVRLNRDYTSDLYREWEGSGNG